MPNIEIAPRELSLGVQLTHLSGGGLSTAASLNALLLGEAAAAGRGIDLATQSVRVRDGHTGPREEGSIGFATLRGGSVIGEHSVLFASEGEMVTLSHSATDRSLFARGALKAATWARDKKPGRYTMLDVLGLNSTP